MTNTTRPTRIAITKQTIQVNLADNWFLSDEKQESKPVEATIQPLVNGERAFDELYQRIEAAQSSIEIAIWGFQPSMFFRRKQNAQPDQLLCIGDLLIKKALEGKMVKVLVWSMSHYSQAYLEPNLGKIPNLLPFAKDAVEGVLPQQTNYDYYWYMAVRGDTSIPECQDGMFNDAFVRLRQFAKSPHFANLQYKNRYVDQDPNNKIDYQDKELPWTAKATLLASPSHHQKMVLIDIEEPEHALGFVLEHNMLDNYWDTNAHHYANEPNGNDPAYKNRKPPIQFPWTPAAPTYKEKLAAPNHGKNVNTPLQDVSALVSGKVLWDLNRNFLESWNRNNTNMDLNHYHPDQSPRNQQVSQATMANFKRSKDIQQDQLICRPELGKKVMAQVLRTYDTPKVEDIKRMYLQNIKKTTSYIYTENQYFRFPPLVDEFVKAWRQQKQDGRTAQQPIHWFVVTNSSEAGMGSGPTTTYAMFERLGKGEQLPKLMKVFGEIKQEDIDAAYQKELERLKRIEGLHQKREQQRLVGDVYQSLEEYLPDEQQLTKELDAQQQFIQQQEQQQAEEAYQKFTEEIGIKSHICTLVAKNSDPKAWEEVYIHSKVTIINDVFLCISSANLNSRSMQVDTELGIITECRQVAADLRRTLWGLHTDNDPLANPTDLIRYQDAEQAYKRWEDLMDINKSLEESSEPPAFPLRKFLNDTARIWDWRLD